MSMKRFGRWVPVIWKIGLGWVEKETEGFSKMLVHICQDYKASHRGRQFGCYVSMLSKMERKLALRSIPKYVLSFFFYLSYSDSGSYTASKTALDCRDI
jgi:hypothetical protein